MLMDIIERKKGVESVVFTDTLPKCRDRLTQLRSSSVPNASYSLKKSTSTIKFAKPKNKDRSH